MKQQQIIETCKNIPNGRFFKARWTTNCESKMTAAAKKEGYIVTKTVASVCRKGIRYLNIKRVRDAKDSAGEYLINPHTGQKEYITEHRSWAVDVVPNLIIKNKNTGKCYMIIYSTETMPKVQYKVNGKPVSTEYLKKLGLMQNSYWNNTQHSPVYTIPIEAIEALG